MSETSQDIASGSVRRPCTSVALVNVFGGLELIAADLFGSAACVPLQCSRHARAVRRLRFTTGVRHLCRRAADIIALRCCPEGRTSICDFY